MKIIIIGTLASLFFAVSSIAADPSDFMEWWEHTAYTEAHARPPRGVRHVRVLFEELIPATSALSALPSKFNAKAWVSLVLTTPPDISITLLVPIDKPKDFAPDASCLREKSWLRAGTSDAWTAVELNPYCNSAYGPDEVDLNLYWLKGEEYPCIEIVTNHPAYVPIYLFQFDHKMKSYKQIKFLSRA